jgi:hypothetical protein
MREYLLFDGQGEKTCGLPFKSNLPINPKKVLASKGEKIRSRIIQMNMINTVSKFCCVGIFAALPLIIPNRVAAQNLPPPASGLVILDLAGSSIPANNVVTHYSASFVASTNMSTVTFVFRHDPSYFTFDNASVADATTPTTNLLLNGTFLVGAPTVSGGGAPDWTYFVQAGVTIALGHELNPPPGGWYDGSVQGYDGIDQTFATTIGDTYNVTFDLSQTGANTSVYQQTSTNGQPGTSGNGIDMLVYAGNGVPPTQNSVGVNKDFVNCTGQTANNFEWLVQGSYTISGLLGSYSGNGSSYPLFTSLTATSATATGIPAPNGPDTLFTWSGVSVPNGATAHVGLDLPGSEFITLETYWTSTTTVNGTTTTTNLGCVNQVPINQGHSHFWHEPVNSVLDVPPGNIAYDNVAQACDSVPLYIGNITLLWYAAKVPLADLNANMLSSGPPPLLTQTIPGATLVSPGGESIIPIPAAGPAGANFVVVEYTVSESSTLAGACNTIDYAQYPAVVGPTTPPLVPVFGQTGLMLLILLVAVTGIYFIWRKARTMSA